MGSDPRRLDGLRHDERLAALLVERATGATARAHDVGRLQGAYDIELTYPDGRTAALEVTTHAASEHRRNGSLAGRDRRIPAPARRALWTTVVADTSDVADLPPEVTALLAVQHVARRAAKVAAVSTVEERHLFVGLGEGGVPAPLYDRLRRPVATLPVQAPEVPDGISHVWLRATGRGSPLICWDRANGWRAHQE